MIAIHNVKKIEFQPIQDGAAFHARKIIVHTHDGKQEIKLYPDNGDKRALIPIINADVVKI